MIMTTRRDTKKYQSLDQNPKVAILIHDFETLRQGGEQTQRRNEGTFSVTVYGDVKIIDKDNDEMYRSHHLRCNPQYEQFITGTDIAVLVIQPQYARICNVLDQVSVWTPTSISS
jgi:hypothetical protein